MPKSYCIAIHVPLFTEGSRCFAASEWARALTLLRDSFEGRFDRFIVVAPSRPASSVDAKLEPIGIGDDGFDPRPSLPLDGGKLDYWLRGGRRQWQRDVGRALTEAEIAHTGLGDLYRPINHDALKLALAVPRMTTVFVRDTDEVTKMRNLIDTGVIRAGPDREIYLRVYARALRQAVARSDLALLKGRALYDRYSGVARNPRMFQDTSYRSEEIVPAEHIARRLAGRGEASPLRLVYCGRLVARKGCDHSIDIVARARAGGADVTLDLFGSGDQRGKLEAQARELGIPEAIRFQGEMAYGPQLLKVLSGYDGLLFTPLSEDTPRMIFDGYAAGLPLLAYDIPYVRERAAEEGATVLLPFGEPQKAATIVSGLARTPGRVAALSLAAHRASYDNATDVWYRRRAEWTLEAHYKRQSAMS